MRLFRTLLFLLILTLAFPSGSSCSGSALVSSIISGIKSNYGQNLFNYLKSDEVLGYLTEITSQWIAEILRQKVTVKLVRNPPQHNCITRSENLTQLKEMFDSFGTSTDDKAVYAVYLVGRPGSGKSELARQYGNLVSKSGEVSTVITLSTENKKQFQHDLIEALLELKAAAKGTNATKEELSKKEINYLVSELRLVLRERPGWLLIVDNIRNKNTTQSSFYKELPEPGSERWGQGYVLLTTQVLILEDGKFVKIKKANEGMTPNDAKQFLCELVKRGKGDCPDGDAEEIVKRLDYLPLAILAAGTFIERKMKFLSYTLAEYRDKFDKENAKAFNIPMSSKTDYPHSMQAALLIAVRNSVEGDSDANTVKDFCTFVGFIDQGEIPSYLVLNYLEMKNHSEGAIQKLMDFPLVDFLEDEKVFRVHQVTRDAFRAELIERSIRHSGRGDLLLENFRNISHFFFTGYDEKKVGLWEANSYFRYVLSHHDYSLNDIVSPDENLEVAASLIFRLLNDTNTSIPLFNCSELEYFVACLLSAPVKTTNTSYIRFTGYRLVHRCLLEDNQTDLSEEYAVKCVEMIKELVPESPALHTMPLLEGTRYEIQFSSVVEFIKSVEPNGEVDSDQLYLSLLRVVTVLYRWDANSFCDYCMKNNETWNAARVCFEEVIRRSCQSEVAGDRSYGCIESHLHLGMIYLKLESSEYTTAAEVILLQIREHSLKFGEQDSLWYRRFYWDINYKVGCWLAEVQIRSRRYSEALSFLEEVLDEYGILLHGNWTRCVEVCGNNHRIRVATEVLDRYHSLYINVPYSLHETMRRVERKSMEHLVRILSCAYVKDLEEARSLYGRHRFTSYKTDEELFRRLLHIINKQISHNETRNLTELLIGVAEILIKETDIPSSLVDELRVTMTTGLTFPLSVMNLLQDSIKNEVSATLPFTSFSLIGFACFFFIVSVFVLSIFSMC